MQPIDSPRSLRARWIFPVDAPPLEHGVVTIAGQRIVAVGAAAAGDGPLIDLGDVALIPGLVNAHTHLEFSDLPTPLGTAGMAFSQWIGQVVARRRQAALESTPDELQQARRVAVRRGVEESLAAGVVALGEIATSPWEQASFASAALSTAADNPLDVTVFLESLGLAAARQELLELEAREHVTAGSDSQQSRTSLRRGLSPHAPYTVRPDLVARLATLSREHLVPVAMHLAESFEEIELLSAHSGGLVEQLSELGAWDPSAIPRGIRPLDYLRLLDSAHRALVIHGNFLGTADWEFLAPRRERMSVVYCPRTQAYFPHGDYPLAEMLAAGVHVAVGTDSRATNPDLKLWSDLRFVAARHPAVTLEQVLALGTRSAAEALGIAADYGTLAPGKRAAISAVDLGATSTDVADPYERLFAAEECRPL